MQHSIFRPILMGILVGAGLFVVSFIMLKVLFFALIAALIFKVFSRGRRTWHFQQRHFAQQFQYVGEEEGYTHFRQPRGAYGANMHRNRHFEEREAEVRPIIID